MKLSRRGKRTNHARRGRHTKRVRKHHTRHIKHRGKQYKRTYRKNNRKLKHNKRIQRGGVSWTRYQTNTGIYTTKCRLTYKKKGELITFGDGEDNPFELTLEHTGQDNDFHYRNNFTVTMIRKTKVEKKFVIYFKLGEFSVYFSTEVSNFDVGDNNKFLTFDDRYNRWVCLRQLELPNKLLDSEIYTFPLNEMNREVFKSFAIYMRIIVEHINDAISKQENDTQQRAIEERNAKILRGELNVTIVPGSPVNYVTFSKGVEDKVQKIIDEINSKMGNQPTKRQRILFKLDETKSNILSTQLKAMITARTDIERATSLTFDANNLITGLDNFKPENISNAYDSQSSASAEHYVTPAPPPPDVRKRIPGVKDERGNDVYETPERPTGEVHVIYDTKFSPPVAPTLFTGNK